MLGVNLDLTSVRSRRATHGADFQVVLMANNKVPLQPLIKMLKTYFNFVKFTCIVLFLFV